MRTLIILMLLIPFGLVQAQNALDLDGVDDYITTTNGGPFGTADRTVECWIKTSTSISTQQVFFDYGAMSPLGSRFTLNVINFGLLRIEVGGNGFNSTQSIADGNWHHVAITYDHSATTKFRMYIDGVLESSQNTTVPVNTIGAGLYIGQRNDGVNNFDGSIDELRVWNVVRTQAEIDSFKNKEFCVVPPNLLIYYKFNQGVASGNNAGVTSLLNELGGNHGTLNNFALTGSSSNWVAGVSMTSSTNLVQDTASACDSLISPSGKYVWKTSGLYYDTLGTGSACDTVVEMSLTVTTIDTSVQVSATSLQANMTGANYQWLDCDSGYSAIPGATQISFTPAGIGNYAVRIELNGCVDTSSCHYVNPSFDRLEYNANDLKIYPNPIDAGERLYLNLPALGAFEYSIFSAPGKLVSQGDLGSAKSGHVLAVDLTPGIYILKVRCEDYQSSRRLIVK